MPVRPDDGGIDHRVFVIRIIGQGLEKTLPNPARGPARKALVGVLPESSNITSWTGEARGEASASLWTTSSSVFSISAESRSAADGSATQAILASVLTKEAAN